MLDSLGLKHGTDKASSRHNYLQAYELALSKFSGQSFTLMELGCYLGSSLNMWAEFFPKAQIIGLDIDINRVSTLFDNIKVLPCDCSKPFPLINIIEKYKPSVIIDDGSHRWSHQILSFEICFDHLPKGGLYICEDLQTSFGGHRENKDYADIALDAAQYFTLLTLHKLGEDFEDVTHPLLDKIPDRMKNIAKKISRITVIPKSVIIEKE